MANAGSQAEAGAGSENSTPRVALQPHNEQKTQQAQRAPLRASVALSNSWSPPASDDDGGKTLQRSLACTAGAALFNAS